MKLHKVCKKPPRAFQYYTDEIQMQMKMEIKPDWLTGSSILACGFNNHMCVTCANQFIQTIRFESNRLHKPLIFNFKFSLPDIYSITHITSIWFYDDCMTVCNFSSIKCHFHCHFPFPLCECDGDAYRQCVCLFNVAIAFHDKWLQFICMAFFQEINAHN